MTETIENRISVTTYRDTFIDMDCIAGRFYAKPKGANKLRSALTLNEIKRDIDSFFEEREYAKREPCKEPVTYWSSRRGDIVEAFYVGTRKRATKHHEKGHAFTTEDGEHFTIDSWKGKLLVVPHRVPAEKANELVAAHAECVAAREKLERLTHEVTIEAELPHVGYDPTTKDMNVLQNRAIDNIKAAMRGDV